MTMSDLLSLTVTPIIILAAMWLFLLIMAALLIVVVMSRFTHMNHQLGPATEAVISPSDASNLALDIQDTQLPPQSTPVQGDLARSIVACRTDPAGYFPNQDFARGKDAGHIRIACLTDGVGSQEYSQVAAQAACEAFIGFWDDKSQPEESRLQELIDIAYQTAADAIRKRVNEESRRLKREIRFADTTLLAVIEWDDCLVVTCLGDGGIWLTTGDPDPAGEWLLIEQGGPTLDNFLGLHGKTGEPAWCRIGKTKPNGEVILIGTDGILDMKAPDRSLKIAQEVLRRLRESVQKRGRDFKVQDAEDVLRDFITDPQWRRWTFPDNQSLGVLITDKALQSWWGQKKGGSDYADQGQNG